MIRFADDQERIDEVEDLRKIVEELQEQLATVQEVLKMVLRV